jgi:hypothetical protein
MYVADEFEEVIVSVNKDGFESPLVEVANRLRRRLKAAV